MCITPAMTSPLTRKPLNPHAKSWIPEAKNPSSEVKKPAEKSILLSHDFYTQPPPSSSSALSFPQYSAIYQHFQLPNLLQPSQPLPLLLFSSQAYNIQCLGNNFHGVLGCYSLEFQPQPYDERIALSQSTPGAPLGTLICAADEVENEKMEGGMDEKITKEKRDSRISCGEGVWKENPKRFVPPRFRRSRSLEEYQGTKKTIKKVWKPRKARSDDGVTAGEGGVVSSSPRPSPVEDEKFCKNYTTVMIRHIPNLYRRDNLMHFLDIYCKTFHLEYDFLYLPMDFWRKDNLGYAFVNFTSAAGAAKIKDLLDGFEWYGNHLPQRTVYSKKICEVTCATIQGKDALVNHFQNSNFTCDNTEYLPVVFSPPRKGSEPMIWFETVGKLKGPSRYPRVLKK